MVHEREGGDGRLWDVRRFDLELERVRLLARRALGDEVGTELEHNYAQLAQLPQLRADRLIARLGLGVDERAFLWTVVAAASDPRSARELEALGGIDARGGATIVLHAQLHQLEPARARRMARDLDRGHALLRLGLMTARGDAASVRVWYATERFVSHLAGSDAIDAALAPFGGSLELSADVTVPPQHERSLHLLESVLGAGGTVTVLLEGAAGSGRRTVAALAARAAGRPLLYIDLARWHAASMPLDALAAVMLREHFLAPEAVLLLSNIDEVADGGENAERAMHAIAAARASIAAPVILTAAASGVAFPGTDAPIRVRLEPLEPADRLAAWARALPDAEDLSSVAARYRLAPGAIATAARAARLLATTQHAPHVTRAHVEAGIRTTLEERMGGVAQRVPTSSDWSHLVLAKETMDQILALLSRVQHATKVLDGWEMRSRLPRGAGVTALFSGPPGTGKTMVAGLVANMLGLELYQIDLSRVVSKWIGETEKQLSHVFDAAEVGHALILFDEADSLFGKRTEVKAANDRYANMEVNYLLQRIEAFEGIAILTTNMDTSIDPALKRRLAAHVVFYPPEEDERRQLWERMLSPKLPVMGKIAFAQLAADYPEMSGAHIRNAVVNAAFLAASEGEHLTHHHLERAARLEYSSMGRVLARKEGL